LPQPLVMIISFIIFSPLFFWSKLFISLQNSFVWFFAWWRGNCTIFSSLFTESFVMVFSVDYVQLVVVQLPEKRVVRISNEDNPMNISLSESPSSGSVRVWVFTCKTRRSRRPELLQNHTRIRQRRGCTSLNSEMSSWCLDLILLRRGVHKGKE
jgi:hypothetical protein